MNAADVLERAAGIIERDGWIQGQLLSDKGCCAMGAICVALVDDRPVVDIAMAITASSDGMKQFDAIGHLLSSAVDKPITFWNDEPGRTRDEVTSLLRAVAATERAREAPTPSGGVVQMDKVSA